MVAKATIHGRPHTQTLPWIPAVAGMTHEGVQSTSTFPNA